MNKQPDIKIVCISIIIQRDLMLSSTNVLHVANELCKSLEREVQHNELLKPCVKHIQVETITDTF